MELLVHPRSTSLANHLAVSECVVFSWTPTSDGEIPVVLLRLAAVSPSLVLGRREIADVLLTLHGERNNKT